MTNKEKYPNAEIKGPSTWGYYIVLSHSDNPIRGDTIYLVKNKPSIGNCRDGWHKTYEQAKTALNNFMNETPEITLKEIKLQFEKAKKLVGKKVKRLQGNFIGEIFKVAEVKLILEQENFPYSDKALSFLRENGYVIFLSDLGGHQRVVFDSGCFAVINEISVTAHDGQTYSAESDGDCWKFGCAKISKSLVREAVQLFEKSTVGNRTIQKITIGKCDFTLETLKALVELENS